MLTQAEIDMLLNMLKKIVAEGRINFPQHGDATQIELSSMNDKEKFIVDVNRKGRIKISKCAFQNRYHKDTVLLRLDIDGPSHTNPNGTIVPPNHLHIYREGYDERWAYPLPSEIFTDPTDLPQILIQFLEYCKVTNLDKITIQGGML